MDVAIKRKRTFAGAGAKLSMLWSILVPDCRHSLRRDSGSDALPPPSLQLAYEDLLSGRGGLAVGWTAHPVTLRLPFSSET